MKYKLKFMSIDNVRFEQDLIEQMHCRIELDCDWFTLSFEPGKECVFLNAWIYKETGPQVVTAQYEHIEEFEYEDMVSGERYGLNAFNDLFWRIRSPELVPDLE